MTTISERHPGTVSVVVRDARGLALVRPGIAARLLSHVRGAALDERLAAGTDAESSVLLAVRAAYLTGARHRRRLAADWDDVAARARRPWSPASAQLPVDRAAVLAAADRINDVADVLRSGRQVTARGVALARALLTFANSPVYRGSRTTEDLTAAVARSLAAM
jgi:hypothetical protein